MRRILILPQKNFLIILSIQLFMLNKYKILCAQKIIEKYFNKYNNFCTSKFKKERNYSIKIKAVKKLFSNLKKKKRKWTNKFETINLKSLTNLNYNIENNFLTFYMISGIFIWLIDEDEFNDKIFILSRRIFHLFYWASK